MGDLGFGQEIHMNSYVGHTFTVKANGEVSLLLLLLFLLCVVVPALFPLRLSNNSTSSRNPQEDQLNISM